MPLAGCAEAQPTPIGSHPLPLMPEAAWLIVAWLIVVGAAVGSFLNVVVYRLPLGLSLIHPPSHCPKCGNRIAWYDNVPVLGWIALRGRCRQCHNPISARYPIVEAITAAMFGAVAVVEMPIMYETRMFGLCPYHLLLLCTLLCAALIEYDGNRVPVKLFVPALIVGVVAPMWWPMLRPLPTWGGVPEWFAALIDGLIGLGVGAALGAIARPIVGYDRSQGVLLGLMYVGLFLGWQAVGIVAAGTAVIECLQWLPEPVSPRRRFPPAPSVLVFTTVWLFIWARLVSG